MKENNDRKRYGYKRYGFRWKAYIRLMRCRWSAATPKIFKKILKVATCISTAVLAIHTTLAGAGLNEPNWFNLIAPYLIGFGTGIAALAGFTREYDERK